MQTTHNNNINYVSDGVTSTGFNIAVNSTMFQMLTSNIYNNPKLAVVREWSTNACDACIAANKEVDFDVHLPTTEDPLFYVRDYGTGLSPEDIVGLFSTLGESTKRNSDALNGCFGIGRMAGLAVADAFTVDSYYKGTHYCYVVSVEDGTPTTLNFGSSPTEEPDGLKLSVSVPSSDVPIFKEIALQLYPYFDHKPNLNYDLDVSTKVGLFRDDKWYIENTDNERYTRKKNKVVLSQVVYDIPQSSEIDDKKFANLVIKAPPGSVSFNPGRESLSLDKKTIDYLNNAFRSIEQEFIEKTKEVLDFAVSDLEAVNSFYKMRMSSANIVPVEVLKSKVSNNLKSLLPEDNLLVYPSDDFNSSTADLLALSYKTSYHKTLKRLQKYNSVSLSTFIETTHIIVDVKTNYKTALYDHYGKTSYVLWQREGKADLDTAVKMAEDFLNSIGIPFVYASTLIEKTDKVQTKREQALYASNITPRGSILKTFKLSEAEKEEPTILYVRLHNTTPIISDTKSQLTSFEEYMTLYRLLSRYTDLPKVYGVAKKYQKYADSLDNWIDLEDYLLDKVKNFSFLTDIDITLPINNISSLLRIDYTLLPEDLSEFCSKLSEYKTSIDNDKHIITDSYDIALLDRLEIKTTPYFLAEESCINNLKIKYKNTFNFIDFGNAWNNIPLQSLVSIADLEHSYYEICKTV